jgi:hypothetical protein
MASYGAMNEGKSDALVCTMCGKEFDCWDTNEALHYKHYIGFGSKYDLNFFEASLCCSCFDKILDVILPLFKSNPLTEYQIVSDDGNKLIAKRKEKEK